MALPANSLWKIDSVEAIIRTAPSAITTRPRLGLSKVVSGTASVIRGTQALLAQDASAADIIAGVAPSEGEYMYLQNVAAATNSGGLVFFPLLFLTPNFVPRDMLTRPMEIAATLNPVTYVMESLRSLVLQDLDWASIWPGFLVVALAGALMLALNVRTINRYD